MDKPFKLKWITLITLWVFSSITLGYLTSANKGWAHGSANKNQRELLVQEALDQLPGHQLTAVSVELVPGNISPAHRHETFVYVYVLEGQVRSQIGTGPAVDYQKGDSWIEPPGALHSLTQNLSKTKPAKLLAIFVGKADAKLTTSGEIN